MKEDLNRERLTYENPLAKQQDDKFVNDSLKSKAKKISLKNVDAVEEDDDENDTESTEDKPLLLNNSAKTQRKNDYNAYSANQRFFLSNLIKT